MSCWLLPFIHEEPCNYFWPTSREFRSVFETLQSHVFLLEWRSEMFKTMAAPLAPTLIGSNSGDWDTIADLQRTESRAINQSSPFQFTKILWSSAITISFSFFLLECSELWFLFHRWKMHCAYFFVSIRNCKNQLSK